MKHKKKTGVQPRLDVAEALRMRIDGITDAAIGRNFGVTRQAVQSALKKFNQLMEHPEAAVAYKRHKSELLTSAELILLQDIVSPAKRRKATQGNAAYAFDKIATHNRLEQGLSTTNLAINISDEERASLKAIACEVAKRASAHQGD